MEYVDLIEKEDKVFLKFLKAKYPMFHNSNFFFRDLQYGAMKFLEKKGLKVSIPQSIKIAEKVGEYFESQGIFVRVTKMGWRLNYPDFVTAAPGDPF